MVKMVDFMSYAFYYNKKKAVEENFHSTRMRFRKALITKVAEKS